MRVKRMIALTLGLVMLLSLMTGCSGKNDDGVNPDGTVTLRVAPGSYRILEKSVPEPYCLAENEGDRVQTVSLNAGDTKSLIFKNSKNPLLKITKIEKGTGEKIPGTVFTLEAIDGDYRHEVTTGAV